MIGLCFFFLFIHSFIIFFFLSLRLQTHMSLSPCIFWFWFICLSLHHICFLFNLFNSICKQIHSYRHHAILVLIPCHISLLPRHATLLSSFFSRLLLTFSLLLAGKCSVDFVIANLFSDLSLTPPVFFHALNALTAALSCLHSPPFLFRYPALHFT